MMKRKSNHWIAAASTVTLWLGLTWALQTGAAQPDYHTSHGDELFQPNGDANHNGQLEAADALTLAYFVANPSAIVPSDILATMDLDADGILTSTDLLQLLNYLAGNQGTLAVATTTTITTATTSTTT